MTSQPSQRPIGALRARMIEDIRVRGFTEKTRNDYILNVRSLAAFIGRSPDMATAEDLRRFQLHQTQTGMQPPSINSAVAALRFFFTVTLDRPDLARRLTIVREPRRLPAQLRHASAGTGHGARIGLTAVLHTWGSALTHHPHAHIIVPGGGFSLVGQHWIACRPSFFLSVRVLSQLFRRLFLERVTAAHQAGRLEFFADQAALAEPAAFKAHLAALRKYEWVVYAKRPFGGPGAVLAYLSRYTHRIAIANSRLVAFDGERVTFRW